LKLQVPENFRLLAFCTRALHKSQIAHGQKLGLKSQTLLSHTGLFFSLVALFLLAFYAACIRMPRRVPNIEHLAATEEARNEPTRIERIDINSASRQELERLPGIGEGLAARIIEHRQRHGRFRRVEHLVMVRGISERRFEQLRRFVKVE
jgi:competence ComEA-like helix-hairpin-helix protein